MARGPIKRGVALAGSDGIPLDVFGLVRLGLVCGLAGHDRLLSVTANFLCYHSAKSVTKVVLGKAPKPVYNLASEKSNSG